MPDAANEACEGPNPEATLRPDHNGTGHLSSLSQDGGSASLPDSPTANLNSGDLLALETSGSRSQLRLQLPPPPPYPQDHHTHNFQLKQNHHHDGHYFHDLRHLSSTQVPILSIGSQSDSLLEERPARAAPQVYYQVMQRNETQPSVADWLLEGSTTGATAATAAADATMEPLDPKHWSSENSGQVGGPGVQRRQSRALSAASCGDGGSRGRKATAVAVPVPDGSQLRDPHVITICAGRRFQKAVHVRRKDNREPFSITVDLLRAKSKVHEQSGPIKSIRRSFSISVNLYKQNLSSLSTRPRRLSSYW